MPQPLPNLSENGSPSPSPPKKLVILQKLLSEMVTPELEETVAVKKHNKKIPSLNKSRNISMETNNSPENRSMKIHTDLARLV